MTDFITTLTLWVTAVIAVEAVTEVLVDSSIFFNFRVWVSKWSKFFGELLSCGYCTSVWVAGVFALIIPLNVVDSRCVNLILCWLVLHRLSNVLHGIVGRIMKRLPIEMVLTVVHVPGDAQPNSEPEAVELDG